MTSPKLSIEALSHIRLSRKIAIENLDFYTCLYDSLESSSEKDHVGQAMVQKQSFIEAIEAILQNHGINLSEDDFDTEVDCGESLQDPELGEHLMQETRFTEIIQKCVTLTDDELTIGLLNDHLKAAELAVTSIKSTSLKI